MPRKGIHQLEPEKMSRKEFESLDDRKDLKENQYEEGVAYRDSNYPEEIFYWEEFPKDHHKKLRAQAEATIKERDLRDAKNNRLLVVPEDKSKGEWKMAGVELEG